MYPFMQLEDNTEIVHSEILDDENVKVYIEEPIYGGFNTNFRIIQYRRSNYDIQKYNFRYGRYYFRFDAHMGRSYN
jgi:hypothetical protein